MVSANCKVWSVATSKQHAFHGPRPPRTQSPGGVVDVPAIYLSIHLSIYIYIYTIYIHVCMICICVCAWACERVAWSQMKPSGVDAAGFEPGGVGGVIVRHD